MLGIFYDLGIIKSSKLIEVQRADLVADVIGGTAKKTKAKCEMARDGILFVDEAYQLSNSCEKDFGKEAIETIMSYMLSSDDSSPLFVFAGYQEEMKRFLATNAGLERRIDMIFHFRDYTANDLAKILKQKLFSRKYKFPENFNFENIFEDLTDTAKSLYNASLCGKVFNEIVLCQEDRLPLDATKEMLQRLHKEDIEKGCHNCLCKMHKRELTVGGKQFKTASTQTEHSDMVPEDS